MVKAAPAQEMIGRDYQNKAEILVTEAWNDGHKSVLVVLPTGSGKTILFSLIILHKKVKTLVICERRELVFQIAEKIKEVTGLRVEIEMGEMKVTTNDGDLFGVKADVVVTTVQTQFSGGGDGGGRMMKLDPSEFGLLVCDEFHHSASRSYQEVFKYYKSNPKLKILGVTATPDKLMEFELGEVFDHVAFNYPLWDGDEPSAIYDGWLVPIVQQFVPVTSFDISHIKTQAGDLSGADLEAVLKSEKPMQQFVAGIFEIMHGLELNSLHGLNTRDWAAQVDGMVPKRSIAFTRFVEHARLLANILNRIKPGFAAYVHGMQNKDERRQIINTFKNGTGPSIIVNCNVLGEGYDDDGVRIVFTVCPTKSRQRYSQWIGRGTRPLKSIVDRLNNSPHASFRKWLIRTSEKRECLVVDFIGNSGKHKLISCVDVFGTEKLDNVIEETVRTIRQSHLPMRVDRSIEEQEEIINERKKRELEEAASKSHLIGKATYKAKSIDPFNVLDVKPAVPRGWDDNKVLSQKQNAFLRRFGYEPTEMQYAHAKQLIGILIDRLDRKLASVKQVNTLSKYGIDAKDMKFDVARKVLDQIAGNGWKKPADLVIPTEIVNVPVAEQEEVPF